MATPAAPTDHAIVHHLLQQYVLDDGSTRTTRSASPRSNHCAFSSGLRPGHAASDTIRCVKELSIEVKNYALSSYATAQAVLTATKATWRDRHQPRRGISDYIVYKRRVVHSGVLGVAGSPDQRHRVGLKIPYAKAELLKKTEGSVILNPAESEERITLRRLQFEERSLYARR